MREPDHPPVGQEGGHEGGREQPGQPGQHVPPDRQQGQRQTRRGQHHQRPVVGEPRPPRDGGAPQGPFPARVAGAQQHQRVGGEEEQRVQGVDLGDDGLRPELLRDAEEPGRDQGRRRRRAQQPRAGVHGAAGQRAEHRARQVPEERGVAERQPREQVDDQRVEGIARRVGDAEVHAGHQEQAVVLQDNGAREGCDVQGEGAEHGRGQRRRVGPAGGDRGGPVRGRAGGGSRSGGSGGRTPPCSGRWYGLPSLRRHRRGADRRVTLPARTCR